MYIDSDFKYEVLERTSNEAFQALWVEIHFTNAANIVCGVIYRQHNSPETFNILKKQSKILVFLANPFI